MPKTGHSYEKQKIVPIRPRKLIRIFQMAGYEISAKTSKHIVLRHPGKVLNLAIPNRPNEDVKPGLISQLIRKADLTRDDYFSLLDKV